MSKPFLISMLLFLTLFFSIFLVIPKYSELQILRAKVSEKRAEFLQRKEYFSHLEQLSKELEKHQEALSKIDTALPEQPNLPSLLEFLQKACSENGLLLKSVGSFDNFNPKRGQKIKTVQFNFEVSGTFDDFMNFLSTLEKSARLIEVSSISFNLPKEGDIFSFKVKVRVHSF